MNYTGPYPPPLYYPARPRRGVRLLLAFVVFFSGIVCGAGLTVVAVVHKVRILRNLVQHPQEVPARVTDLLRRRLNLTPEQVIQIEPMIAERQKHLQAIRREVQPRVISELDGMHDQISQVLTPEQQIAWDRMYDETIHVWMPNLEPSTQP